MIWKASWHKRNSKEKVKHIVAYCAIVCKSYFYTLSCLVPLSMFPNVTINLNSSNHFSCCTVMFLRKFNCFIHKISLIYTQLSGKAYECIRFHCVCMPSLGHEEGNYIAEFQLQCFVKLCRAKWYSDRLVYFLPEI